MRTTLVRALLLAGLAAPANAQTPLSPCEAYGAAKAVFIGEAGAPVARPLPQDDGTVPYVKVSPLRIIQAFRGVSTAVVFVMPAGIERYLVPGERYLVYGREYHDPDMFMSTDQYGTKLLSEAAEDIQFLSSIAGTGAGSTISGVLERDESDSAHIGRDVSPLGNVIVRLASNNGTATALTRADGSFELSLAAGTYLATADLPDGLSLVVDPLPRISVVDRGCAMLKLRATPDGRIMGTFRMQDGRPNLFEEIRLLKAEVRENEPDGYFQSVRADEQGHFVFKGVRPGKYRIGRLAYQLNATLIPAVYYPGVANRKDAELIEISRGETRDIGDFYVPTRD